MDWQRCPEGAVPVVSMERFSGTPHAGRYDSEEIANRLHRTFPEGRVLVVVREQEALILSGYRQYVKNSGALSLDEYLHPPYEPSVMHQFSYGGFFFDRLVAVYDDLFGAENVLVLPYETFRSDPVAYMASIARFAGLDPHPEILEGLRPADRSNVSLTALGTALKRRVNRVVSRRSAINPSPLVEVSERKGRVIKYLFYSLERWLPQGRNQRLDARERALIRSVVGPRYEASNAALATRMGVDLGSLGYRLPEGWTLDTPQGPPRPSAPDPHPLTFHIIYTPGTVDLLVPFVASLLQHSPFRYCLVPNGCGPEERDRLVEYAATSPRLETRAMPTDDLWRHGDMLDWLFAQSTDPYFAFMDSDIFAIAPFGDAVTEALSESPIFSACSQSWAGAEDRSAFPGRSLGGRHLSVAGRHVGTSFFAVYERASSERIRETYGVGFAKYAWDELPAAVRGRFSESSFRFSLYDTGKALNLLLRADGIRLGYDPLPALVHLGGVSDRSKREKERPWWMAAFRWNPAVWSRVLSQAGRTAVHWVLPPPPPHPSKARRSLAWRYFGDAIPALQAGQPPPPIPDFDDPFAQREIERVVRELVAFYAPSPVRRESVHEA